MKIQLLYFDGCPNWVRTEEALREALREASHADARVELVRVETPEEAEARRFVGSPTVLIDGRDPFSTGDESVGFACRLFRTPHGFAGSPTMEMLREALQGGTTVGSLR